MVEIVNGKKVVKKIVYYQSLFYVLKIIRIELTSYFGIKKLSKSYCQKKNTRPTVPTKPLIDLYILNNQ